MTNGISRRFALASIAATGLFSTAVAAPGGIIALRTEDGRDLSITVWRARRRRGTILFSHGALSSPWKYAALIDPWVAAGYDVWAPLHVDSTEYPDTKRFPGLASWPARIQDMRALAMHVGATSYVAAGHSYGALVALTLAGATPTAPAGIVGPLRDRNVKAVVAFSPPGPGMGLIDEAGYATVAVPALIETGTADTPPGTPTGLPDAWRAHLSAYTAATGQSARYAIVLDGADHYFGGLICRLELPGPHQTQQLADAIVISRLFLDGYGAGNGAARAELKARTTAGEGVGLHRR